VVPLAATGPSPTLTTRPHSSNFSLSEPETGFALATGETSTGRGVAPGPWRIATTKAGADKSDPVLALEAGSEVFKEGDEAPCLWIVLKGRVEVLKAIGSEKRHVALLGPGDLLGAVAALAGQPHAMAARAETESRLLEIEATRVGDLVAGHPAVGVGLLTRLARQLHEAWIAPLAPGSMTVGLPAPPPGEPGAGAPAEKKQAAGEQAPGSGIPRLVFEPTGKEFPLPSEGDIVLGRSDPRTHFEPDVDLSSLDEKRSLSRSHARIVRKDGGFEVTEEPRVRNGTFLNGRPVKQGKLVPLAEGDELRLGVVKTTFRLS